MCRNFDGPFKHHIIKYISLKTALGYSMQQSIYQFNAFDKYTVQFHPNADNLTEKIAIGWCKYNTFNNISLKSKRASFMRRFGVYLQSIGEKAFVIPTKYFPSAKTYIPHIYTDAELIEFFSIVDNLQVFPAYPLRNVILPIVFRMMYICGLRSCEIRNLKIKDVDLQNGNLTIFKSKNDNSRIVPMSISLNNRCREYSKVAHNYSNEDEYYFLTQSGYKFSRNHIYAAFRSVLSKTSIAHKGRGKGPRAHDFRHTFAVHRLKNWVENDIDLQVYFPVLKTYLGHCTFDETAYYLRMTADVYPSIVTKLENKYPDIIPALNVNDYETN